MILAVADTTLLSNFAKVERPELVQTAFPGVVAPEAVLREIQAGERLGHLPSLNWSWIRSVTLTPQQLLLVEELRKGLGPGESQCLAFARSTGALFLTDDRKARLEADALGIPFSGTLGVFTRLLDSGSFSTGEAEELLQQMIAGGYRSPVRSIRELPG